MDSTPGAVGVKVYVQVARPTAGCQVSPPSVDTSTPPTTPPPESAAVPLMVTGVPWTTLVGTDETVMLEVGRVRSVFMVARNRPDWMESGWMPMSANRLTVDWRIDWSGVELPLSWTPSRPKA